jgi:hypothetical protein
MVYCLVVTFNAHRFTKHEYYYASRDAGYIGNFSRNSTRQTKRMQKVSENDKLMFIQMRNLFQMMGVFVPICILGRKKEKGI